MRRPAILMYTVSRGGERVKVKLPSSEEIEEPFIDAMRHYPPLHNIVGKIYVYDVIWRYNTANHKVKVITSAGRSITIAPPRLIELHVPRAAPLGSLTHRLRAFQKLVYAYGYVDKSRVCIPDCPIYEYLEAPSPGTRSVRSVILYLDESVLQRYHDVVARNSMGHDVPLYESRSGPVIPYYQPIVYDYKKRMFCIYVLERGKYDGHPVLHEAFVYDAGREYKECLARLLESLVPSSYSSRIGDPLDVLVPYRSALVVTTPPRFYPQYESYMVEIRNRGGTRTARIGIMDVKFERLDARVAIILESVRAYIRGRLVAPKIRNGEHDSYFGDILDTQAIRILTTLNHNAVTKLKKIVEQDAELRSKLAYHLLYEALRSYYTDLHDENVQHAALKLWSSLRLYHIMSSLLSTLFAYTVLKEGESSEIGKLAIIWSVLLPLYPQRCINEVSLYSLKRQRLPSDAKKQPYDAVICTLLALLEEQEGIELFTKNAATRRRCLERVNDELSDVYEAAKQVIELLRSKRLSSIEQLGPDKRLLVDEFIERAIRHTIVHWLVAVQVEGVGLASGDVEVHEEPGSSSSIIYEMFEGGVGATRSIASLLEDDTRRLTRLAEWLYGVCLPMKAQHQMRSILAEPAFLGKLWARLRGSPRESERVVAELRSILGEEPLYSVVERVSQMISSADKLIEMLTVHALVDAVFEATGLYPRPSELASLYTITVNIANGELYQGLVRLVSQRISKLLAQAGITVDTVEEKVERALRRVFEGRATLEELLGVSGGESGEGKGGRGCRTASIRSIALAMEEYGALWWLDGHPICHGIYNCGRIQEERDINAPLAYLSPRLLQEAIAGRP